MGTCGQCKSVRYCSYTIHTNTLYTLQVRYCSRACQRAHWKNGHKRKCIQIAKAGVEAASIKAAGVADGVEASERAAKGKEGAEAAETAPAAVQAMEVMGAEVVETCGEDSGAEVVEQSGEVVTADPPRNSGLLGSLQNIAKAAKARKKGREM
jgi:hypothetical protein